MERRSVIVTWHSDGAGAAITVLTRDGQKVTHCHVRPEVSLEDRLVLLAVAAWQESTGALFNR